MSKIGEFDPHLRPLIRVVMRGAAGREQTIEARLDTGFDLLLAVAVSVVESLGLQYVKTRPILLSSGETFTFASTAHGFFGKGLSVPFAYWRNQVLLLLELLFSVDTDSLLKLQSEE